MLHWPWTMHRDTLNPLTFEEHRELAQELRRTRARMIQLFSVVAGVYGQQNLSTFAFTKVNEALDRVVGELAAQAEVDYPGANAGHLYIGPEAGSRNGA